MIRKIKKSLEHYSLRDLINRLDIRYGLGRLECCCSTNWFNPFATLWLNLRSFPFKQAIAFPIWCYGRPRFYGLSGRMLIKGKVTSGMIRFNQVKYSAPSNMSLQSEIQNIGLIIFRGKGFIGTGCKIVVGFNAVLDIGKNFKITDMCNIGCLRKIHIGEQSRIVHRCQVFDSNYHYVANFSRKIVSNYIRTIHIGKDCWICNSSTITGGTVLPDYTIVGSNSLINKDFSDLPQNSMIGGIPAKLITTGVRRVNNNRIEKELSHFFKTHPDDMFPIPEHATPDEYSCVDTFK